MQIQGPEAGCSDLSQQQAHGHEAVLKLRAVGWDGADNNLVYRASEPQAASRSHRPAAQLNAPRPALPPVPEPRVTPPHHAGPHLGVPVGRVTASADPLLHEATPRCAHSRR